MPVAPRLNSVNWLSAITARTPKTTTSSSRRSRRNRVRVERETCETAGDMATNLVPGPVEQPRPGGFPYANWGAGQALLGVVFALVAGLALGIPFLIAGGNGEGELTTLGSIGTQACTALGF